MTRQYTEISEAEMDEFLVARGFQRVDIGGGVKELVYSKFLSKGNPNVDDSMPVCLRVYTSIAYGSSRDSGQDAIRLVPVTRRLDGSIRMMRSWDKTYRIETWRKNLDKKLKYYDTDYLGPICVKCGHLSVHRVSEKEKGISKGFHGCITFPTCRWTKARV